MIKSVLQLTVVVTALLLAVCCQSQESNLNVAKSESAATAVARHAELGVWGVDLSARKESIKAGDNFFEYANGTLGSIHLKFLPTKAFTGLSLFSVTAALTKLKPSSMI
jgi:hypothetical protein